MKQQTKISCDHNDIVFEKDVTVTTREREKLAHLVVANASGLSGVEADLGIYVSIVQKNKTDTDVFKFTRRCTYPVYKDDFDSFETSVKQFMEWFAKQTIDEINDREKLARLKWVKTLEACSQEIKEVLSEIEQYGTHESGVSTNI